MSHAFKPGQILLDKYRVERVLGAGGMGIVVAARHLALDELVAIKFMLGAGSQADLTRFVREARAAVRLRSQHVARVLDVAALDDGTPYMVLEHLHGSDLSQVLRERGPLPVAEAVDAILQACEAIAEAHSIGIIHRDIKPANLFSTRGIDGSQCIKVLDFGIAKWTNASTAKMDPSQPMGSAPYMAPEQFGATSRIDPRTDVWALGATLFHLLTGKPPFYYDDVDSIQAMMHAVLYRPPLSPSALGVDLPEAVETILLRCLEKDQGNRFPSVAALAAVLAPFGSEHAAMYSRRVAKVLGEPEPVAQASPVFVPPATMPHATRPRPEAQTAPLPQTNVTEPIVAAPREPETSAPVEHHAPLSAAVSKTTESPVAEKRDRRRLVVAAFAVAVSLVAMLVIGIRLGRRSTPADSVPTPEPIALQQASASVLPAAPSDTATPPSSAPSDTTTNTPARLSTESPSRAGTAPRRPTSASPTSAPSSTAVSKEDLYGRRR